MFPASSTQSGQCLAFPDVCKVPAPPSPSPVPTPFPNTAQLACATGTSTKVTILNLPVVTKKSEIPSSQGDEAGVANGVVSGTIMGKLAFNVGSARVKVEGQPVVYLGSATAQNGAPNANCPGGAQIAPSQTKVLIGP